MPSYYTTTQGVGNKKKENREKSVVIRVKCSNNSCLRWEQLMGRRLMTIAGIPASGNLQQTREDNWHYNHHLARARTHTHTTHLHTLTHWRDITFGTWKAETERNVHMGGGKRNRFVDGIIKDYIWDQTNWKKKRKSIFSSFFFLSFDGLAFCWLGLFSDQNVCNNDDDHKMMIITTSVASSFFFNRQFRRSWPGRGPLVRLCDLCTILVRPRLPISRIRRLQFQGKQRLCREDIKRKTFLITASAACSTRNYNRKRELRKP